MNIVVSNQGDFFFQRTLSVYNIFPCQKMLKDYDLMFPNRDTITKRVKANKEVKKSVVLNFYCIVQNMKYVR